MKRACLRRDSSGRIVLATLVALLLTAMPSPWTRSFAAAASGSTVRAGFDHAVWDRLVSTYVDAHGRIAYASLQNDDEATFAAYLDALATARPNDWPEVERLAFWINAYNAGIIAAVLQGQSAESLLGRGKIFKLWKFEVAGKRRTLDEIEHKILRKEFAEPRIHFAIVCASTSCPKLRSQAFVAETLDAQLEEQAFEFINDPSRNRFDRPAGKVELSKIFDWFEGDFERDGDVLHYVSQYVEDPDTRAWLREADIDVKHLDYDWTLNVQNNERPERKSRF